MFKNREKFSAELEYKLYKEKLQFGRGVFIGILAFIAFLVQYFWEYILIILERKMNVCKF